MSHIAFESNEGRVEVSGSERAFLGCLVDDLAWALRRHLVPDPDPEAGWRSPEDDHAAKLRWTILNEESFIERLGLVCLVGNDTLKLAAHIHGQCEIHGWVHPGDGEWFADQIRSALRCGTLRQQDHLRYGEWEQVAELAERSESPLVSSYSVCGGWPDPYLIADNRPDLFAHAPEDENDDDSLYDRWAELGLADQQRIADEAIADCAPRWHPAQWGTHWAQHAHKTMIEANT